jgi:hypothetical protein
MQVAPWPQADGALQSVHPLDIGAQTSTCEPEHRLEPLPH